VARKYRVSRYLVSKLVCLAQREPEKLRERKEAEKARFCKIALIKDTTNNLLDRSVAVTSCKQIQEKVAEDYSIPVGSKLVTYVMTKEMNLVYRQVKKVAPQANSQRCLVLRQQYAISLMALLAQGKRIINVDETWLNETNFQRKTWCRPLSSSTV